MVAFSLLRTADILSVGAKTIDNNINYRRMISFNELKIPEHLTKDVTDKKPNSMLKMNIAEIMGFYPEFLAT